MADEAFQLAAKNAGLSEKAATKLFERASRARTAASQSGPMFGGGVGVNIGIGRFNPAGYLFDPRKGPVGARVVGGIEGGIDRSLRLLENPGKFLGAEGLVAAGSGTGAMIAQEVAPYDRKRPYRWREINWIVCYSYSCADSFRFWPRCRKKPYLKR